MHPLHTRLYGHYSRACATNNLVLTTQLQIAGPRRKAGGTRFAKEANDILIVGIRYDEAALLHRERRLIDQCMT